MDEDWEVLLSFLPQDWRELARDTGALKGLRKDKAVDNLLRTLLLHLGCGHSLRETVVRARQAYLADLSDVALLKRLKSKGWLHALCVRLFEQQGLPVVPGGCVPGSGRGCDDGEGTGTERVAVAPALQRGPAVADVRLLQADGDMHNQPPARVGHVANAPRGRSAGTLPARGNQVQPATLRIAEYVIVLTTFPDPPFSVADVPERWRGGSSRAK